MVQEDLAVAERASSVRPGEVLGGAYRILRAIDEGGMGTVFEAEHVRLRRRLAVKIMAQHLVNDEQALARFQREAEIISQLAHPHIVHVSDFDTTPAGEPYLVMELLEGESLAVRLEREGTLSLSESVRIAWQVALGLSAAHTLGIVHRDLKPGNVFLVDLPTQKGFVKLLDFGISKGTGGGRKITREFDILGTPDYMAPEQALGRTANVDARADQFSLACIVFECLAGRMPFTGTTVMEVLQAIIGAAPLSLRELAPGTPEAAQEVLERALAKKPEERYGSVTELVEHFAIAAQCALPGTGPTSAPPQSSRSPRRPPTPAPSSPPPSTRAEREKQGTAKTQLASSPNNPLPDGKSGPVPRRVVPDSEADLLKALGGQTRRVRVIGASHAALTPEQAFMLSRLEGGLSVEEALDVSPLPRRDSLRVLVELLHAGHLAVE